MRLKLDHGAEKPLEILCLGSHSDDIEIGCGGTILQLAEQYPGCIFHWVVFSASGVRETEARHAAELFAGSRLKGSLLKTFRDGFMPYVGSDVKAVFETELKQLSPDLVFTHNGRDAHQDHRLISELTWNTFRDHLILEYEIPKYDGGLATPNVYVPIDDDTRARKVEYLMRAFGSQRRRHWFTDDTFTGLMRLRGIESGLAEPFAEGFHAKKLVLAL